MEIQLPQLNNLPLQEELDSTLVEQLVTQLDTELWLTGSFTKQDELEQRFKAKPSDLLRVAPRINKALKSRGLPEWRPVGYIAKAELKAHADLDPLFVIAVTLICDTLDKRSRSVKLKTVGMDTKRFQYLLEDAQHLKYFQTRVDKAFKGTSETAKLSLTKNVEAGDLQSIKYYHEFSKEYNPNQELQLNLNKLISLFFEILVKHVPIETVKAIGDEFEIKMLESGK